MTTIELEARKAMLVKEMESILLEREKESHFYTHEQVKKEMKNLIASWNLEQQARR